MAAPREVGTLRNHKDATAPDLKARWRRQLALVRTHFPDEPTKQRQHMRKAFGEPPYDFLDGELRLAPSSLWLDAPEVPIVTSEYAFEHPGPNHFGLRVDFSQPPPHENNAYLQFQLGTNAFARRVYGAIESDLRAAKAIKAGEHVRVVFGRQMRPSSLTGVRYPLVDDTILLENWRYEKKPIIEARVLRVYNAPRSGQSYFILAFLEAPE